MPETELETRRLSATATSRENVRVSTADVAVLRWIEPCWDALPRRWRADTLRSAADDVGEVSHDSNTTTHDLGEWFADSLTGSPHPGIDKLAIGTSSSTPNYDDESLSEEFVRTDPTELLTDGTTARATFFLTRREGNNAPGDLQELGMYAGEYMLNRSLFDPVEKTDVKAVAYEIALTLDDADSQ